MCGRFILLTDLSVIVESFGIHEVTCDYRPGNNISPGQQATAIIHDNDKNRLVNYRWGLIPSWANDPSIGNRMFNATSRDCRREAELREGFSKAPLPDTRGWIL